MGTKISQMPLKATLDPTDIIPLVSDAPTGKEANYSFNLYNLINPLIDSGVSYSLTLADFKASKAQGVRFLLDPSITFGQFYWETANAPYTADNVNIIKADSTSLSVGAWVRQSAESISLAQGGNIADAIKYVTPQMLKLASDLDDTASFQRAFDSGLPIHVSPGEYKFSDTFLLDPGTIFIGAGGAAKYEDSPVKFHFEPPTKRGVFRWRTAPTDYVFAGTQLTGFCIRGFGAGASTVLDLPFLYGGLINFYCYAGVDGWIRLRQWLNTKVYGGVQGFNVAAVEFAGDGLDPSDVTTSTAIDAYISQGPTAYLATSRAVTDCKITGVIESVDKATDIARGNVTVFDIYTENAPRTDAGSAWEYGKTGTAPATETALTVNLQPGIGYSGGTLNNANAFDVDQVRFLKISGYSYLYKSLLKTTANTQKVVIIGLDTDNIALFSPAGGIADYNAITMAGFKPANMELTSGSGFFDGSLVSPSLRLWSRERTTIEPSRLFLDASLGNKLCYRDDFGNFSDPIPRLKVSGNSGWTVQGGRLSPGETVRNSLVGVGEVALWQSMRYSRDVAHSVAGCTTVNGSPTVTAGAGAFNNIDVEDWVTASAGFPTTTDQYRVLAKAANGSSITLDTNATSGSGAATIATEAHQLVSISQQGFRGFAADPVGVLVPKFLGEIEWRPDTSNWYISTGLTNADWKLLT